MKVSHHLIAATALACATSPTWSQAINPWVGPAAGLAVQSQTVKTDYTSSVSSINGQNTSASESSASLIGSWGFALSEQWVAILGLSYGLSKTDISQFTYTFNGTQRVTAQAKDHLALSIAPGYRLHPQALVYAKIGYHQLTAEYTDTATSRSNIDFSGVGYGVGASLALSPQYQLRVEYETVRYGSKSAALTTAEPTQNLLSLGLLYKF
ncbi:MAG: porin family protein [Curvibacter sp.]